MEGGIIEHNQIRGPWGITGLRPADLTIRNNVVVGGAIELMDDPLARTYAAQGAMQRSVIEGNVLHDAWIAIGGDDSTSDNAIRRNVVRGGGITLFNVFGQLRNNVVEGNFVSGSPDDGISVFGAGFGVHSSGSNNIFRNNTSIGNAGCDIRDTGGGDGRRR